MGLYELIFEVDGLGEDEQDAVYQNFDALISGHGTAYYVTLSAEGPNVVTAARTAISRLTEIGVHPYRMVEDLVTRAEIARRLDVAVQAVGQWVRGERRADSPFPEPHNRVGGGVWLWSDVVRWSARVPDLAKPAAPELEFPRLDDHVVINFDLLAAGGRRRSSGARSASRILSTGPVSVTVTFTGTTTSSFSTSERSPERMGSWQDYGLAS